MLDVLKVPAFALLVRHSIVLLHKHYIKHLAALLCIIRKTTVSSDAACNQADSITVSGNWIQSLAYCLFELNTRKCYHKLNKGLSAQLWFWCRIQFADQQHQHSYLAMLLEAVLVSVLTGLMAPPPGLAVLAAVTYFFAIELWRLWMSAARLCKQYTRKAGYVLVG